MTGLAINPLLQCWGKANSENPAIYHPAVYHMVDVGNVAKVFLSESVSSRWKRILGNAFHCDPDSLATWLPWIISLHDIGKLSASFQAQSPTQASRLRELGFSLNPIMDIKHPLIGQAYIKYENQVIIPDPLQEILTEMIGGHHGYFSQAGVVRDVRKRLQRDEPEEWRRFRIEGVSLLQRIFQYNRELIDIIGCNISTAIMALTGFTILCDWIGSNSIFFPPTSDEPLDSYLELSASRALLGVREAGFMIPCISKSPVAFSKLFANIKNPRPLQLAVDRIPNEVLAKPCLVVIEAPTGEGKTETALAVAHRIAVLQGSDEFYYALPTTATSNQMYLRIQTFLRDQLGLQAQTKLVHSQAFLMRDSLPIQPLANGEKDSELFNSLEWFSPKKRSLLAPFGVGTVDQAELGALNVAHNALRLVGLAGKVLILDEVHAYDTYMSTILARLLSWLAAMGTSVILLSATLPRLRREILAKAYGAVLPSRPEELENYPLIYVSNNVSVYTDKPSAAQNDRAISISPLHLSDDLAENKARWILDQIGERGCWCWITNTVQRAQEIFRKLDELSPPDVARILIHSRFPLVERERIERQLTDYFGPEGNRPVKAIVIGTQVLEQSLDLDFDGMVSDLAPIDLLLQRVGRLHRHSWRNSKARGLHTTPHFYIYEHITADGTLNLSSDKAIYAEYLLRQTVRILAGRNILRLPTDYRTLVSGVYDSLAPGILEDLYPAWKKLLASQQCDRQEAELRLLPVPDAASSFCIGTTSITFQEDEDRAGWIVAQTRLGEESVTVIPLEKRGDTATCVGSNFIVPINQPASMDTQYLLLRTGFKISGNNLCAALRETIEPPCALFQNSALLKNVIPLWLENGCADMFINGQRTHLDMDARLGLIITRKKGLEDDKIK